ncbi:MAG: hypothetical protein HRU16_03510, partial [Planctomycetes bacterium]|nr:hypothetical protein [Planctomycetota bacterium]
MTLTPSEDLDLRPIRRALVAVSDKSGIVEMCSSLAEMGIEILSTGGPAAAVR